MTVPCSGVAAVPGSEYSYTSPYTQYSTGAYGGYGYTTTSLVGKLHIFNYKKYSIKKKANVSLKLFCLFIL